MRLKDFLSHIDGNAEIHLLDSKGHYIKTVKSEQTSELNRYLDNSVTNWILDTYNQVIDIFIE